MVSIYFEVNVILLYILFDLFTLLKLIFEKYKQELFLF